ncbi:MAG: hypothetical protein KDB35_06065, partial [Acidimicrobiales bacterium]|nr:hypothetical protein [Acidimicrobiales bacterium]
MRRALIDALVARAERDPRVVLLTGDLGFTVVEPFAERFPDRFVNVGVAEQNLVGLATGMAEAGMVPFTYSLASFTALRPYEFVRNGPVLHRLPVRLVGVGGGFEYGVQGATHHGLEDLGVLRLQPGLTVVAPADGAQLVTALDVTADLPGPVYYRVGKTDPPPVPGLAGRFRLGRAEVLHEGDEVVVLATGAIAGAAAEAAGALRRAGRSAGDAVVACVAPPPVDDLVALLRDVPVAVTVEAHYAAGGLGSVVAEVVADHGLGCRVVRQGVRLLPGGRVGSQAWFEAQAGLT